MNHLLRLVLAVALSCLVLPAVHGDEKGNKLPDNVRAVLDKAESVEVYSLDPAERNDPKGFHGWKVLGKTMVKDTARKDLLAALDKGLADAPAGAKCFLPRHGLRVTGDGQTVDLVICFECSWVYVYVGDKEGPRLTTSGKAQATFDKALKDASVPSPK